MATSSRPDKRAHKGGAAKPPSQRQLRVGELIRHALAEALQRGEVADPSLDRVSVTVPEVRMSPDLKRAVAHVVPLGGAAAEDVVAALSRHRRYLRGLLARRVDLKYMPQLEFAHDQRFEDAERIDAILRSPRVARDLSGDGE